MTFKLPACPRGMGIGVEMAAVTCTLCILRLQSTNGTYYGRESKPGGIIHASPGVYHTMILLSPSVPPRTFLPVTAHLPSPLSHFPTLFAMNFSCLGCVPTIHL
jgi:hypothetical protein